MTKRFPGFEDPLDIIETPASFLMSVVHVHESFDFFEKKEDYEMRIAELKDLAEQKGFKFPTDEEIAIASDELDAIGDIKNPDNLLKFETWLNKHNI